MALVTTDTLLKFIEDCRIRRQIAWNLDYPTNYEMETQRIETAMRSYRLMQLTRTERQRP